MGYARVFWIREEPIRQYIGTHHRDETIGKDALSTSSWPSLDDLDDDFIEEVGKQVLSLSVHDSAREFLQKPFDRRLAGRRESEGALPLFDTPSVFFPFKSFHSTDFCVLLWTGSRLCPLPEVSPAMFDTLCELASTVGTSHVVLPISEAEMLGGGWKNPLEYTAHSSLYYIYEDFTRGFLQRPETEWPCKEVGTAALNLMLSNWSRRQSIPNLGSPALSKCCSFIQPEIAVAVWSGNCLRLVSEIEADELQGMREYLGRG